MKTGIQISSFKPLMTTREGLNAVLDFYVRIGCRYAQLQWIDKSIEGEEVARQLDAHGIYSLGTQDKSPFVFEEPKAYIDLCACTKGGDICVSGAQSMGVDAFLRKLDALEEICPQGVTLSFHPLKADFETALNTVMAARPRLRLTLDLCQAHDAGENLPKLIKLYTGRIDIVHFKDRDANGDLCAVGEGVIDFERAAEACAGSGVKYLLAEQETWQNAYEELGKGFEFVSRLNAKYS